MDDDVEEGMVHRKITYDYILELYEEIKEKDISETERDDQFAVLKVLAEHIDEYMVVKYKTKENIDD